MADIQNPHAIELKAETLNLLEEVKEATFSLSQHRPFDDEVNSRISREFLPDRVTASLNIEGIGVTRRQTLTMMDAMTLGANSSKEEQELLNALQADEYVFEYSSENQPLTSKFIREVNSIIQKGILPSAGKFRVENVEISGAKFQPPDFADLPSLITNMAKDYQATSELHPVVRAAWLHAPFTHIHPFKDGNGRTGRLLQDFSLLTGGLYPTGIPSHLRDNYYDALEDADSGLWDPLCQMICQEELSIISRVQAIVDEVKSRGEFISLLAAKAAEKKTGALHKQYVVWKQRMENFSNQLVKTCDQLNAASDVIQVRSEQFDVINFEKWKRISDTGEKFPSWLIKQTWFVDGSPLYRSILYFQRHRFRPDDVFEREDLHGNVALFITGGEPSYGARFDFENFSDAEIRLREIFFMNGQMHKGEYTGQNRDDNRFREIWSYDDVSDSSVAIKGLIEDVFIRKLGIG